jgi:HdeA/HdeB family
LSVILKNRESSNFRGPPVRKTLFAVTMIHLVAASSNVQAQTDLTAYADANGYVNVQALTCAQLAGTWQGDADRLTTWYSGWYNGLAKKHYFNIARAKELEHEVIVYCKENPQIRIIEAMDVMLKQERFMGGFK